jgi:anti-anti-sigma factor
MGIQDWSEDIILVDLPQEPEMADEIKAVTEMVRDRGDCDVIIDFSGVDIITSYSLSKLLNLHKSLIDCSHKLVLCSVAASIKGVFMLTALDRIIEVAGDMFVALTSLQKEPQWELNGRTVSDAKLP